MKEKTHTGKLKKKYPQYQKIEIFFADALDEKETPLTKKENEDLIKLWDQYSSLKSETLKRIYEAYEARKIPLDTLLSMLDTIVQSNEAARVNIEFAKRYNKHLKIICNGL